MSLLNQLAKRIQNPRKKLNTPKPLFALRQVSRLGAQLNDLTHCSISEYIHQQLNTSQITLPESLSSCGADDTFEISLNLQLCILVADLSQEEHQMSSASYYLVREFMSNFIGGQTSKPEGSALSVAQNCLSNLQHYRIESADIQSQEQLKIVLHLGHHLLMEELSVIPVDDTDDLNDRKDLILEALTAICNSDFSAPRARFLLALR
jgi:hypothetical protein